MDETCRDTVTTALMTHTSVISLVNVHSSCTVCSHVWPPRTYTCALLSMVCDIPAPLHTSGIQGLLFLFFISAKSSQLLHPVLYSTNTHIKHTHTHTHTRQLHRRLWNSLLPWQWNRARSLALPVLFYCFISPPLSRSSSLSLCGGKPASLVWHGACFLPPASGFECLFICLFVFQWHMMLI